MTQHLDSDHEIQEIKQQTTNIQNEIEWCQKQLLEHQVFKRQLLYDQEDMEDGLRGSQYQQQMIMLRDEAEESMNRFEAILRDKEERLYRQKVQLTDKLIELEKKREKEKGE